MQTMPRSAVQVPYLYAPYLQVTTVICMGISPSWKARADAEHPLLPAGTCMELS